MNNEEKLEMEFKEEDMDTLFSRWEIEAELKNAELANRPHNDAEDDPGDLWRRNKPKFDQINAEVHQMRLDGVSVYERREYRKRREIELGVEGL